MSYHELARRGRTHSPFSANLSQTVELLGRELRAVQARQIILQVALRDDDIRLDGFPKANRTAAQPGVILAFESSHGPLKFAVDRFWSWEDNLRAVALAMEALRKVDRYGVTKRGEQYTGWRALPQSTDAAHLIATAEDAREFMARWGGNFRAAVRDTHPDAGGDPDDFRRVMRAKELLGQ